LPCVYKTQFFLTKTTVILPDKEQILGTA
jgi:hypothetical protein